MTQADVAVVGFGPVGAVLAGLLGARGLRVVVLDRDTEPFRLPRAAHVDHTGLRALQELGVLDEVLPAMIPNPGLDFVTADRRLLMRVPGDQGSRSGLPASMYFHQPGLDRAIRVAAQARPSVSVRLGAEVTGVRPDPDGVTVEVAGTGPVRASWVVGCDGATSTVRETLGLPLRSFDFDEQWLVVDLVLPAPVPGLPAHAVHVCDPARPHTAIPMPGGRYRFELMLLDGDDREWVTTPAGVEHLLQGWLPPGAAVTERAAVYTFHGLVADEWRRGRVLLAGDAAHQMPPFLGQGMCSGLRDAVNMAWKLDAVAGGTPEALLDTYATERRPHVSRIVADVVAFGEIICTLDPDVAAARDTRFLADPAAHRIPFGLPALDPGPLVLDGGGRLFVQPGRLDDRVGPRFLVLATDAAALGTTADWWRERAAVGTPEEIGDPGGVLRAWLEARGAGVVVVRPDRYVLGTAADLDVITHQVRPLLAVPQPHGPGRGGSLRRR